MSHETPEQIFLSNLKHIEKAAKHAARRHRFRKEDAEDFVSTVEIKIIEDDYRVIRMYKGTSTLRTYLTSVVHNFLRDYTDHLWGKWRNSAEAVRQGNVATKVEELLGKEEYTQDEAYEILRTNLKAALTRRQFDELIARLPPRARRRIEGEEALEPLPAKDSSPEENVLNREQRERLEAILEILAECRAALPKEDQLILKMCGEFKPGEIAKVLGLDARDLYRRIDRLKQSLKKELERRGVQWAEVEGCFSEGKPG
jgi:RNA polymerase sigma factor (sigma-70 family)